MVTATMETRTRKRRWQSSPDQRTARASLNFDRLENTPPRKRRCVVVDSPASKPKQTSDVEADLADESFNIKSFYGGRQKKHFPHSPGRRKAASRILSKLSDENSASEEDVLTFKSSNEDSSPSTDSNMSMAVLKTRKLSSNNIRKVTRSQSFTEKRCTTPITPSSQRKKLSAVEAKADIPAVGGRKFFKHKSPASASKAIGSSVIIRKGFNLKFVPMRSSPNVLKAKQKTNTKSKQSVPKGNKTRHNKDKRNIVLASPIHTTSDILTTDSACHTDQTELSSPERASNGSHLEREVDASMDLFPTSSEAGSSRPSEVPSAASSMNDLSDLSSVISGPSLRSRGKDPTDGKKYFSIFSSQGSAKSSPIQHKSTSPRLSPCLRIRPDKDTREQMILDAGQKQFGAIQCEVCSMVYTPGDPTDDTTHSKFHESLLTALRFPGWKKERVVQEYPDLGSRIIMVLHDDPKYAIKKVEEINKIMGKELGFPDASLVFQYGYKVFLYVSEDKMVEGCCVAESVAQGYRVIADSQSSQSSQAGHRPWCCQSEPQPASVGISRIWVHCQQRKKGIASKLLDCVRQRFEYGFFIEKKRIAFSDPTPDGKQLATKYTGTPSFLVYKYG